MSLNLISSNSFSARGGLLTNAVLVCYEWLTSTPFCAVWSDTITRPPSAGPRDCKGKLDISCEARHEGGKARQEQQPI
eukprot:3488877-Amphidinium_carterae.1